jgi:beta-galactosidase GanA
MKEVAKRYNSRFYNQDIQNIEEIKSILDARNVENGIYKLTSKSKALRMSAAHFLEHLKK